MEKTGFKGVCFVSNKCNTCNKVAFTAKLIHFCTRTKELYCDIYFFSLPILSIKLPEASSSPTRALPPYCEGNTPNASLKSLAK